MQPEPDRPFQRPDMPWIHIRNERADPVSSDQLADQSGRPAEILVPAPAAAPLTAVQVVRTLLGQQHDALKAELQRTADEIERLTSEANALGERIYTIYVALALSDSDLDKFIGELQAASPRKSNDG